MTPGGGMVFIFTGIFTDYPHGQGFVRPVDDEIAAVLAHEIAHVTLMHIPERITSGWFTDRDTDDIFYQAAYSTKDEAEADKLSMLYLALAGYEPSAAVAIWSEAHRKQGSDPGRYLYTLPLNAQRIQANAQLVGVVAPYYRGAGNRNSNWAEILADNPLFPRAQAPEYSPGVGAAQAAVAVLDAMTQHEKAKTEAARRELLAESGANRIGREVTIRSCGPSCAWPSCGPSWESPSCESPSCGSPSWRSSFVSSYELPWIGSPPC